MSSFGLMYKVKAILIRISVEQKISRYKKKKIKLWLVDPII